VGGGHPVADQPVEEAASGDVGVADVDALTSAVDAVLCPSPALERSTLLLVRVRPSWTFDFETVLDSPALSRE
jgi:hypothetical protein